MFGIAARRHGRLTVESLQIQLHAINDQLASAAAMEGQARAALEELRTAAKAAGLSREMRELESPASPSAEPRREVPSVKIRVITESFVTQYETRPWYGVKGDVFLVPRGLATVLVRGELAEEVDPSTALHVAPVAR